MSQHPYPVARIGIVGGGQLGRMMVKRAEKLGCSAVVLDPTPDSPAGRLALRQIVGDYFDPLKLRELVEASDVTTFDLEGIDAAALTKLAAAGHAIRPSPALLEVIQDKLVQREELARHGVPVAEWTDLPEATPEALAAFGYPLVQKSRRGGYDGRGVEVLRGPEDLDRLLGGATYAERFVEAEKELAVLVARGFGGEVKIYPVVEMLFVPGANLLDMLLAPARISPEVEERAQRVAAAAVEALAGSGVFGVELFLTRQGEILVNEVSPRTHNSGHYTIEACMTDQFEQHLRAILGLPMGSTELLRPAAMINLLGEPEQSGRPVVVGLDEALAIPGVSVHLYGKAETRPLRKMGHVTVIDDELEQARQKACRVREILRIEGEEAAA